MPVVGLIKRWFEAGRAVVPGEGAHVVVVVEVEGWGGDAVARPLDSVTNKPGNSLALLNLQNHRVLFFVLIA